MKLVWVHTIQTRQLHYTTTRSEKYQSPCILIALSSMDTDGTKQVGINNEHGISVVYNCVKKVSWGDTHPAHCAQNGVGYKPTAISYIFITHDVDNIISIAQGNFSLEFYAWARQTITQELWSEAGLHQTWPLQHVNSKATRLFPDPASSQTPFATMKSDHPSMCETLYAITKLIQWQYPDTLRESNLVVMMAMLHTED